MVACKKKHVSSWCTLICAAARLQALHAMLQPATVDCAYFVLYKSSGLRVSSCRVSTFLILLQRLAGFHTKHHNRGSNSDAVSFAAAVSLWTLPGRSFLCGVVGTLQVPNRKANANHQCLQSVLQHTFIC